MIEVLLGINLFWAIVSAVLLFVVLWRVSKPTQGIHKDLREELRMNREEARCSARDLRQEVGDALRQAREELSQISKQQQSHLDNLNRQFREVSEANLSLLDRMRNTFDTRVRELQEGNEKKLEEMRKTVDEKLHDTLEKRLGESFKLVSDRLEAVHKGLGEMQHLATGVGDLKRVLTNVKARGTWAEVQLGAILDQILNSNQYERNVAIKPDALERVEFAVRLPGPKNDPKACIWLPIDSKFPQEDYLRVQEASEKSDLEALNRACDNLARTIRLAAGEISEKYIYPPFSTDFAIMFLATEGLYAEVLRQPSLIDDLQQKHRVIVAGPTTLAAILNSLRMGFQTLAIEQRATEVWRVLGAIKAEFGKFGDVLDKVKRQLHTASCTIEKTGARTRAIEKKLHSVEQLNENEAEEILSISAFEDLIDNESDKA